MTIWIPALDGSGPRYRQIAEAIGRAIDAGRLAPGDKLPPQRRLAHALGVTVGTVTRGYTEAEKAGRVVARVGSGTYVADHESAGFTHVRADRGAADRIDLGLALPPPLEQRDHGFTQALAALAADRTLCMEALDYQPADGLDRHRHVYADWMTTLGLPAEAAELIVTLGGMNGIFAALTAVVRSGERIAAERLTYPGLISVAAQLGLRTVALAQDDKGLVVDDLAMRHARQPFSVLYVMPDHQNPTTARLSEARRIALVEFARTHDVWLIEDAVQFLPAAERGTPLYRLAPERTIFLFSISKILSGGLRSGVMRVPASLREAVATVVRNISWMPPPLIGSLVCRWIASGNADAVLAAQWAELDARREMVVRALSDLAPVVRPGGFFAWLPLPPGQRAAATAERLAERGVLVTAAEAFCLGSEGAPQALRLCFSAAPDRPALSRALDIVRETIQTPRPGAWQTI